MAYLESYDLNILVTAPHIKQMSSPVQKLAFSFNSNLQITRQQKNLTIQTFYDCKQKGTYISTDGDYESNTK